MFELRIRLSGFKGPSTLGADVPRLKAYLEELARDNARLLMSYRSPFGGQRIPLLYQAGVSYADPLDDTSIPAEDCVLAYERKIAKCDTLAAWRLGELWLLGYRDARIGVQNDELPGNVSRWHAGVDVYGDGRQIEDPSKLIPQRR